MWFLLQNGKPADRVLAFAADFFVVADARDNHVKHGYDEKTLKFRKYGSRSKRAQALIARMLSDKRNFIVPASY